MFLDAVDVGAEPGSTVLLDSRAIATRFPQVSTHRLSLGFLAQCLEQLGVTRVWLLGVQPASLRPGTGLSPAVDRARAMLQALLVGVHEEALAC